MLMMSESAKKDTLTWPLLGTDGMSRPTGDLILFSPGELRGVGNMEVVAFPEPPRPVVCYT